MKIETLKKYGIPEESITYLLLGGVYFEVQNGISMSDYWENEKLDLRDEFFIIANLLFSMWFLIRDTKPKNNWREEFDVAFLCEFKAFLQNVYSIDTLIRSKCYLDALSICRTIISRVNLLIYFSINPSFHDDWLKNLRKDKYRDANIRKELEKYSICSLSQLYSQTSAIVHSQFLARSEAGFLVKGIFPEIKAIENKIYVISKFLLAIACYSVLSMLIIDQNTKSLDEDLLKCDNLFDFLIDSTLDYKRVEHIFLLMPPERHWQKIGDNEYETTIDCFDFKSYRDQLVKIHYDCQKKEN